VVSDVIWIEVHFDGLCQPYNPGGIACYAFIIKQLLPQQQQQTIYTEHGLATAEPFTDNASNNVAEYTAVIKALEWLLVNRPESCKTQTIVVKGDSQLVIYQIKGKYKVKAIRIIPLHQRVMSLISRFKNMKIEWIPREQNKEADRLSYEAYRQFLDNNPQLYKSVGQYMATPQQLALLRKEGIKPQKYLSKIEAARLISKILKTS
jgi:ribonuclease HI